MTREEAKVMEPIMKAFSEGKTIECRTKTWEVNKGWRYSTNWKKIEQLIFSDTYEYRIKPEPNYRPFNNKEECWNEMLKHQPFGWIKSLNGDLFCIDKVFDEGIVYKHSSCRFEEYLEGNYTFADGIPFGIKED